MKQTLETFLLGPLTSAGSAPKVRVAVDTPFIASTLEYRPAGDETKNYTEITLTAEGNNWRFPSTTFDTTNDSSDPNATCTAYIVNAAGKLVEHLWERWMFSAGFGASVSFAALEVFNTHRIPLRDDQVYTKTQINLLLASMLTPLTIKAAGVATLAVSEEGSTATVVEAAVGSTTKILLTGKGETVSGTPKVVSQTAGVGFTIQSNNAGDEGDVAWVIV